MTSTYGSYPQYQLQRPGITPAVKAILVATISVFILQLFFDRGSITASHGIITDWFGLWPRKFLHGAFWQLFTYMLVHNNASPFHIFMNMLMLFFIGPETERMMGTRHFVIMYLISGVLGGLSWVLVSRYGVCVGASGAIFGILGAMTALEPRRPITLLVFFVLPVRMQTWVLMVGLMVLQSLFLIMRPGGDIAYGVHVAGGIAGYIYTLMVFRPEVLRRFRHRLRMKGKLKVVPRSVLPEALDIDRVLDKVAREGLASLSRKERDLLDRASRELRS